MIFVVLVAGKAFLADAFGLFYGDEAVVQVGECGAHPGGVCTFTDTGAEVVGQLLGGTVGIGIKDLIFALAVFILAEIDLAGVATVGALFAAGHLSTPPDCASAKSVLQ